MQDLAVNGTVLKLATINGRSHHNVADFDPDSDAFHTLVAELVGALIDSGRFLHQPDDKQLINSARLILRDRCKTLTNAEIDQALDRWLFTNDAMVNYD